MSARPFLAAVIDLGFALGFGLGLGLGGRAALPAQEAEADIDVDGAIDAGVESLFKSIEATGWIPESKFGTGYAALQVYALIKSDVSYQHPLVQKGIEIMESYSFEKVYSVSLYLMAYDAMVEQIDADGRLGEQRPAGDRAAFMKKIEAALEWLINARHKGEGAWTYEPPKKTKRWDHSNTQFAVLALGVAAERKLKVPADVWEEIVEHFVATQDETGDQVEGRPVFRSLSSGEEKGAKGEKGEKGPRKREKEAPVEPGKTVVRKTHPFYADLGAESVKTHARGWQYSNEDSGRANDPRFSMVCAGLSSLLLAEKNLPAAFKTSPKGEALKKSLRDGYAWLVKHFQDSRPPGVDPYGNYSLEKVGDLGEVISFGGFAWYEKIAAHLVRTQRRNGAWGPSEDAATERAHTALALLTLDRATDLGARNRPFARITRAGGPPPDVAAVGRQVWVYLPSLKGEVPVGRLFRLLKYRPNKQILKYAEEAVKVYDPNRMSELVHPLLGTIRQSRFPQARDLALKLLSKATGVTGTDPTAYEEWAQQWEEAERIGKQQDIGGVEKLRDWLRESPGGLLKVKVIWALQRIRATVAMGDLVRSLEDKDPAVREAAYQALTFLSNQAIPFHSKGSEKVRAGEVKEWREWVESQKGKAPPPAEGPAQGAKDGPAEKPASGGE